jgi:hypothetical protein
MDYIAELSVKVRIDAKSGDGAKYAAKKISVLLRRQFTYGVSNFGYFDVGVKSVSMKAIKKE